MAIDFPSSPTLNQRYTFNGRTWQWNGTAWVALSQEATAGASLDLDPVIAGMIF
jgi:hypothetical protein